MSDLVTVSETIYSRRQVGVPVQWVLAVPADSSFADIDDLRRESKKRRLVLSTELCNVTKQWCREHSLDVDVEFSWGATEAKAPYFADGIVECVETGASLRSNGLRILATIMHSSIRLVANPASLNDSWKRERIEMLGLLLSSACAAEQKVRVTGGVPSSAVDQVAALVDPPGRMHVTSRLGETAFFEIALDRQSLPRFLPKATEHGAFALSASAIEIEVAADSMVSTKARPLCNSTDP